MCVTVTCSDHTDISPLFSWKRPSERKSELLNYKKNSILLNLRNYTDGEHDSEEACVDDSFSHIQLAIINFLSTYFNPINFSKTEIHLHSNPNIHFLLYKKMLLHYKYQSVTNA